jgi:hypothetical protein
MADRLIAQFPVPAGAWTGRTGPFRRTLSGPHFINSVRCVANLNNTRAFRLRNLLASKEAG